MSGRRRKALSPSLFPFLAVLVCTLGTLILLLALVAQKASDAAVANAENEANAEEVAQSAAATSAAVAASQQEPAKQSQLTQAEATSLLSEGSFRVEQLVSVRKQQTDDIERRRDQMTQVEAHMKRIAEELERLRREARLAMSETDVDLSDTHELDSLRRTLQAEADAITTLKGDSDRQTPRIAIIPHKGPNGTDRRPIYLECTAGGLTIWPEGAKITSAQLSESVENANPLDASLRVIRHYAMQNYGDPIAPYPLLVVRPGGIETYGAARSAMKDWDDQFGYELVPADTKLAYATADARLKSQVDEAIRTAVINQHGLNALATRSSRSMAGAISQRREFPRLSAAAMDRKGRTSGFEEHRDGFGSGASAKYNGYASAGGGSDFNSGTGYSSGTGADVASKLDQQIREATQEMQRQRGTGGPTDNPYHLGDATGLPATDSTSQGGFDGTATLNTSDDNPSGSHSASQSGSERGSADAQTNGYLSPHVPSGPILSAQSNPYASSPQQADATQQANRSQPDSLQAPNTMTGEMTSQMNSEMSGAMPGGQQGQQSRGGTAGTESNPQANRPASGDGRTGSSHRASSQQSSQSPQQNSQQNAMEQPPGSPPAAAQNLSATRELVQRKGAEWALPREVRGINGNAIVRTIRVECFADRLVLVGSARGGATEIFGIANTDMNRASLELASAVRDRIQRWGAAIPGGRWQPLLNIDVKPGGEERFYQLRQLLSGSGVDVEGRKSQ